MKANHARMWRKWRESKLMSQRNLALALGLSTRTIQNIEAGSTTPSYTSQSRLKALQERHRMNGKRI